MHLASIFVAGILVLGLGAAASVEYSAQDGILFQWDEYKQFHEKVYQSSVEDSYRKGIYLRNSIKIAAHNRLFSQGLKSYRMAMNHLGDLDLTDLQRMTGLRLPANSTSKPAPRFLPSPYLEAPDELDWRNSGYVTPVKNQGSCGSCWAFSTTGALEGQHFKKSGELVSLSEQNLVDCNTENGGCKGGWMPTAYEYIRDNGGIDTEEAYPYEATRGECRFNENGIGATDEGYATVTSGDEDALKEAVASVGPISVAIMVIDNFFHYKNGIYDGDDCPENNINHAVLVVGYGSEDGNDFWLVKNSWSAEWGDGGYIKMARNKGNRCSIATYASYPLV